MGPRAPSRSTPGDGASPRSGAQRRGAAAPQAERERAGAKPRAKQRGALSRSAVAVGSLLDTRTLFRQSERLTVKNGQEIFHNGLVYYYPDGAKDILVCSAPLFRSAGWEAAGWGEDPAKPGPSPREKGKKSDGENMLRSMRRARAKLRRLALANNFEYFVTLTLDPEKIDRYDGAAIVKALGRWADNMVRRHGLRYILVPEQHKDGASHFHGFFAGGIEAVDSGIRWDGRPVYNLPQWPYGFSTAQRLYGDYHAAVAYCCKYIGKQQGQRPLGRWYYSGGALREPSKIYIDVEYTELDELGENVEFSIPGAKIKIIRTKGDNNENK